MTADTWRLHPQLDADTVLVARLPLSELRLMRDANYPWLVLVPRVAGASELIDLDRAQQHALLEEVNLVSRVLGAIFTPDKLNVAALGNVVAQLHVHVVARLRSDVAWPRPVWGVAPAQPYSDSELHARVALLATAITSEGASA